eukprot:SAG31_NODE_2196_length_6219_cov_1.796569_2_plen_417_part_00
MPIHSSCVHLFLAEIAFSAATEMTIESALQSPAMQTPTTKNFFNIQTAQPQLLKAEQDHERSQMTPPMFVIFIPFLCVCSGIFIYKNSRSRGRNKYTRVSMNDDVISSSPQESASLGQLSGNAKILLVTITAFGSITVAQLIGALVANSLALLGDVASMGVDTATYVGNLFAECSMDTSAAEQERNQLVASFVSLLVLVGVSLTVVVDAVGRIEATMLLEDANLNMTAVAAGDFSDMDPEVAAAEQAAETEAVDPVIVCGFAVAGLVLDCSVFAAFRFWGKHSVESVHDPHLHDVASTQGVSEVEGGVDIANDFSEETENPSGNLNMMSAFLHVFADSLRSFTTLLEAALIGLGGFNGRETDAYASLFVSATILLGACVAFREWLRQFTSAMSRQVQSVNNLQLQDKSEHELESAP